MVRALVHFMQDDRGTMTIEFVLWIPIIVALLVTAIDATTLYVAHTEMWNVARDTARRMVTGRILTEAEAEAYALNAMNMRSADYAVEAKYDENSVAEVTIAIGFSDISIAGYGSPLSLFGTTVGAHVVMRPDKRIPFGAGT